jgi:hypothetical protein
VISLDGKVFYFASAAAIRQLSEANMKDLRKGKLKGTNWEGIKKRITSR